MSVISAGASHGCVAAGTLGASHVVGASSTIVVAAGTVGATATMRWPKAIALLLSCRKQLPLPRMPVSTLTRPRATTRSAHSSPFPTRVKPRTQSQPSRVGIIPLHFKRRHFTRGAAPSAKSTTLATSAMASLECAAASSSGASSNVAPQHMPVAVDTTVVQS